MSKSTASALAALALLCTPLSAVEEAASAPPVELGVAVTATSFYARNYSSVDHVLLFQRGDSLAWRTLAPGCDLSWSYPTQQLDGVHLEIAAWKNGAWSRTGTVALDLAVASGVDSLWVTGDRTATTWSKIGSTYLLENTGPSVFPDSLPYPTTAGTQTEALVIDPMHVPEITPSDEPIGDVPPVIDDGPLPPV